MRTKINVIWTLFIFTACNPTIKKNNQDKDGFKTILVTPDSIKEDNYNSSRILKKIDYIPLESNPDAIVGSITKLMVTTRSIYIFDRLSNVIFVFKHDGKFKYKISKKGMGPGEYVNMVNFTIDYNTEDLFIHDERGQKILKYNTDGKFVSEYKTDLLFRDFIALKNSFCFYANFFPNHLKFKNQNEFDRYIVEDIKNKNVIYSSFKYKYNEHLLNLSGTQFSFNTNEGNAIFFEKYSSKVYDVSSTGKLLSKYHIDFGKYNIPPLNLEMNNEEIEKYNHKINKGKYCRLLNVIEAPSSIHVTFAFDDLIAIFYYLKQTKKSFTTIGMWINNVDNVPLPFPSTAFKDDYYTTVNADEFKAYFKDNDKISNSLKAINQNLKESDNPILIKYALKK